MSLSYCEKCGATLHISDYPFCPHSPAASQAIVSDELINFVQENFGDRPEVFQSKKAMLKRADELNLRPTDRWAGPGDKYLSNWAAGVTAKTLEDARILLSRGSHTESPVTCETATFSTTELPMSFGVERS